MKNTKLTTLLSLFILIFVVIFLLSYFGCDNKKTNIHEQITNNIADNTATEELTTNPFTDNVASNNVPEDILFIGDSRTVGIMEYSDIPKADFFCNVGMSVYNIYKNPVSVPNVGKLNLSELLSSKQYGKIYIMLGINEIGYGIENVTKKYNELLIDIINMQPDAKIIIEANLHVTKNRSDSDKIINNTALNDLNLQLKKLANNKDIFFIDANIIFDDKNGNLSEELSGDGVHLYAKYYKNWGEWIIMQSQKTLGEI